MEALKLGNEERLRFRVHRDQGVVTFFGSIGDTPDTAALNGVLTNQSICDMRQLAFASWIGLATLGSYMQGHKIKATFKNLPFGIYDALRLNKSFEEVELESAEMPLVNVDSGRVSFEMIDLRLLRKDAETGNEWVYPKPGHLLLIPTRYVFPDLVVQRAMGFLPVQVLTDQKEIASFWLQYGSFCQSTVQISDTLVHAAQFNMLQILGEIKAKMGAGEIALKLIDSKMNYTLVHRIEIMIREIEGEFESLSQKVGSQFQLCEDKLAAMSLLALDKGCDLPSFGASLQAFAQSIEDLNKVAATCEDCGANIGSKLGSLRSTQVIKNALATVSNPDPDTLTAIREAFAIMDIMSEDDWFATRTLVMTEIETVETLIGRCVVTLQVFDMMRQILEHRIKEMGLVLVSAKAQGAANLLDPDLRDAVLGKIGAHMVTEQEKAAFAFYLPAGFEKFGQTERKEPGDVLLF